MTDSVRFSIVKYSYTPDFPISTSLPIASENKISWTTVGNPNMCLAIEASKFGLLNSSRPELCLKVMRDSEIMELVQLQRLCEAATSASWNQKPIQAVVSSPRLAITYHIGEGNARRIQFRFATESDFQSALRILEDLRCPITAATNRPQTGQRPPSLSTHPSDCRDRPNTSSGSDFLGSHRLSTPAIDPDTGIPSQSDLKEQSQDPMWIGSLTQHAFVQNQQRPLTAPSTNIDRYKPVYSLQKDTTSDDRAKLSLSSNLFSNNLPEVSNSYMTLNSKATNVRCEPASNTPRKGYLRAGQDVEELQVRSKLWLDRVSLSSSSSTGVNISQTSRSNLSNGLRNKDKEGPAADLRAYAASPDSERQALIDNMLCRYMNDDNFLQLCEDVETSWRRIGIDMSRSNLP